jgi:MYXO-CTERM domain-containing protein
MPPYLRRVVPAFALASLFMLVPSPSLACRDGSTPPLYPDAGPPDPGCTWQWSDGICGFRMSCPDIDAASPDAGVPTADANIDAGSDAPPPHAGSCSIGSASAPGDVWLAPLAAALVLALGRRRRRPQ